MSHFNEIKTLHILNVFRYQFVMKNKRDKDDPFFANGDKKLLKFKINNSV